METSNATWAANARILSTTNSMNLTSESVAALYVDPGEHVDFDELMDDLHVVYLVARDLRS